MTVKIYEKAPAAPRDDARLTLEHVVASLGAYPLAQTQVIPTIMRMTSNLDATSDELARVLSADPALAVKVIHLANSPFYGCPRTIDSLPMAIQVLGFWTIRSLAAAASAYTLFNQSCDNVVQGELWRHSLAVGIAARLIARRVGSTQIEEELFLTGLLHDVSKLVLMQKFDEMYGPVLNDYTSNPSGHLIVESTALGFTHADLSAVILEQWGFPERMIGVIHRYCIPDLPFFIRGKNEIEKGDLALPHILCFAHELASATGHGFRDPEEPDLVSLPSTAYLGFNADTIQELSHDLTVRIFEEHGFFVHKGIES